MTYTDRRVPRFGGTWTQPVQFETPSSMTGAALTDGRGVLVWVNAKRVRVGFVSSPRKFVVDGSCTSATTMLDGSAYFALYSASCFRVGADLFVVASFREVASRLTTKLYIADSAASPTSLTEYATLQDFDSGTSNDSFFGAGVLTTWSGIPYVSGSRWVLPHSVYARAQLAGTDYNVRRGMIWLSTDSGATWVTAIAAQIGDGSENATLNFMSSHVGRDPATGYLYWGAAGSAARYWYQSTDVGSTWTVLSGGGGHDLPFLDNGTDLYKLRLSGTTGLYRQTTPELGMASGESLVQGFSFNVAHTAHICPGTGRQLYLFNDQYVMAAFPLNRPTVGRVGFR